MHSADLNAIASHRNRRSWLQAGGSLTARLRRHGPVQVVVLSEGVRRLWHAEAVDLRCRVGYVREVAISIHGVPAVWARSATSCVAARGAWQALQVLANRPLAELLFGPRQVQRSRLRAHRIARHGPVDAGLRRSWARLAAPAMQPRWARSSVFFRRGAALRVMEAFAPWALGRCPRAAEASSGVTQASGAVSALCASGTSRVNAAPKNAMPARM